MSLLSPVFGPDLFVASVGATQFALHAEVATAIGLSSGQVATLGNLQGPVEQLLARHDLAAALGNDADQLRRILSGGAEVDQGTLSRLLASLVEAKRRLERGDGDPPPVAITPIRTIFVPNRGEAASRLITAARELSLERGERIRTVVMYTDVDKDAPFVADADVAIWIRPDQVHRESYEDPATRGPKERDLLIYNDYQHIEAVLGRLIGEAWERGETAQSIGVWPGWGFQSEREELSDLVSRLGVRFMGPSVEAMRAVGDKIGFKRLADREMRTWSGGAVNDADEAVRVAERLGYPVVVKATAGGGGRGIKFAQNEGELREKFPIAKDEALRAFKNDTVFVEKAVVPGPGRTVRHIEVQVISDHHGHVVVVGDRDCSVQRDNQKVIEESPAPGLSRRARRRIHQEAIRIVREANYRGGAATVEGLFIAETGEFQPMELNARLQVEHTITEQVTGVDLVKEMIRIAEGRPLSFLQTPQPRGTAFEIRINAEDPDNDFEKTGGTLRVFRPPTGPGIRVDTGVRQGTTIQIGFDPMVAKLIVWAGSREEAMARARRALGEFAIDGMRTNRGLAAEVLDHGDFRENRHTTRWLEEYMARRKEWEVKPFAQEAILVASVLAKRLQSDAYRRGLLGLMARGRPPSLPPARESRFNFSLYGHAYEPTVLEFDAKRFVITVDGVVFEVTVCDRGEAEYEFLINGEKHRVIGSESKGEFTFAIDGVPFQITKPAVGEVTAPTNGKILRLIARKGQTVKAGDVVAVLEVMKIEQNVRAGVDGIVEKIPVKEGAPVTEGQMLLRINTEGEAVRSEPEAQRIEFKSSQLQPAFRIVASMGGADETAGRTAPGNVRDVFPLQARIVRQAMLGYDLLSLFHQTVVKGFGQEVVPSPYSDAATRLIAGATAEGVPPRDVEERVLSILEAFIDIELLFQREAMRDSLSHQSLIDQFYEFMRTRQASGVFKELLERALARYRVASLDPSPSLDQALAQILIAHDQFQIRRGIAEKMIRVLRKLSDQGQLDKENPRVRSVLNRFTKLDREHVGLTHTAEGLLFSIYEAELGALGREDAVQERGRFLEAFQGTSPGSPERRALLATVRGLPFAMTAPLMELLSSKDCGVADIAGEAIFYRLYDERHRPISHESFEKAGVRYGWGAFEDGDTGTRRAALTVSAPRGVPVAALRRIVGSAIETLREKVAADPSTPVDNNLEIIVPGLDPSADLSRFPEELALAIGFVAPALNVKRITFTILSGQDGPLFYTFRRDRSSIGLYVEDPLFRDIHPFRAAQIELWRLMRHFEVQKISVPWEGTHLFLGTEKAEPGKKGGDRRLFAHSIVSHLSPPVRGERGQIIGFPEVDLAFGQAVHSIQEAMEGAGKGSDNHRITLHIRAEMTATEEEIRGAIARLAHKVRGMGVEQTTIHFTRLRTSGEDPFNSRILVVRNPGGTGLSFKWTVPQGKPDGYVRSRSELDRAIRANARRGLTHPVEFIDHLVEGYDGRRGSFRELDVAPGVHVGGRADGGEIIGYCLIDGADRPPGQDPGRVVFGLLTRPTLNHHEGITVMQIANDPTIGLCPLEEGECIRIIAALDYAERHGLVVDWKATSCGAGISMRKGTENLDWTARVAKRIGEFASGGGEINIIVDGINVGAQAYWDSIATMLLDRRGILIMTPSSATILTGKDAQNISGSVGAETNIDLGGAERITGPNGEAQFYVPTIQHAQTTLWLHHDLTWKRPGDFFPASRRTEDPHERDVMRYVHSMPGTGESVPVGPILADSEKKRPFPVEALMSALMDQDVPPLERWGQWKRDGADLIRVQETTIGGGSVMMIGVEARPLPRGGDIPPGYPPNWSGSTLFPEGSKKMARAIRAASGQMPAVILANLAGFDGSPESLANCQLEFGAEIEEAVREFQGPIIFLVTTRYHGGAYVVFSKVLNPNLVVGALDGTFASVIGGAVAVKLIFAREIDREAERRLGEPLLQAELAAAPTGEARKGIRARVRDDVETEYLRRYDSIHTVGRARDVGSIHEIVPPHLMRPWVIDQLRQGRSRYSGQRDVEINIVAASLARFFDAHGEAGEQIWMGLVRAAGMVPHLPVLLDRAWGTTPPPAGPAPQGGLPGHGGGGEGEPARPPDLTDVEGLGQGLQFRSLASPGQIGDAVYSYRVVGSTMQVAEELARQGFQPGLVVVADRQTEGRGSRGRTWESPGGGKNLYLSTYITPGVDATTSYRLSYAVAAAVTETARELVDSARVEIKWPNDVYIDGKKAAGILIEEAPGSGYLVGIGLNVNSDVTDFGEELARSATSVLMAGGRRWDLQRVLRRLVAYLNTWIGRLNEGEWMAVHRFVNENAYFRKGSRVQVTEGERTYSGEVIGVSHEDGALMVMEDGGSPQRLYVNEPGTVRLLSEDGAAGGGLAAANDR